MPQHRRGPADDWSDIAPAVEPRSTRSAAFSLWHAPTPTVSRCDHALSSAGLSPTLLGALFAQPAARPIWVQDTPEHELDWAERDGICTRPEAADIRAYGDVTAEHFPSAGWPLGVD